MKEDTVKLVSSLVDRVREEGRELRSGLALAQLTASWVDTTVRSRWEPGVPGIALLALGGSGRAEMSPYSDIDLMFFHNTRELRAEYKDACLRTVYALWDDGFDLGYSIRNIRETKEESSADIRTRNALLDARFIAGDQNAAQVFFRDAMPSVVRAGRKNYLKRNIAEREARRREYGGTPFLLEPNVKESPGGLRDLQTALWLSRIAFGTEGFRGLDGILNRREVFDLYAALDLLWKIRIHLHLIVGRKNDILDFSVQEQVAQALGYGEKGRRSADERLMSRYFLRVRSGEAVAKRLSERAIEAVIGRRGGPSRLFFRRLSPPFRISKGYLVCLDDRMIESQPSLLLRAFALSARYSAPLSPSLLSWARNNLRLISGIRSNSVAGEAFLEILRGPRITQTLRAMHSVGVLGRYIPEFGRLQCLVVRDPFHRYTVDEHSLHVVRVLEDLEAPASPGAGLFDRIRQKIGNRLHLLILAALLHDTAKGGRSPIVGEHHRTDVGPILDRFPLAAADREFVRFLVLQHQYLSTTAQKRETEDDNVVREVGETIGDRVRLGALYLLTYADQSAVRPGFWSHWRSHLITDLYLRADRFLEEGRLARTIAESDELGCLSRLFSDRYTRFTDEETLRADALMIGRPDLNLSAPAVTRTRRVPGGALEIALWAAARPGMFAGVAALFASRRLNIVRAQVFTSTTGHRLLRFTVSNWDAIGVEGDEQSLRSQIETFAETGRTLVPPVVPSFCPTQRCSVALDNVTYAPLTAIEIVCSDRLGLLYDLATLIEESRGEIISARIATDGTTADDTLYVSGLDGLASLTVLQGLCRLLFPPDCRKP